MPDTLVQERKISLISLQGEVLCRFWYGVKQFDGGQCGYFLIRIEELE